MNSGSLKSFILIVTNFGAIQSLLSWPVFSTTSYFMLKKLLKQGLNPDIIIDVGANKGQFSVAASKIFTQVEVHSYEPVQSTYDLLKRNTSKLTNIITHCCAVGEVVSELPMHVNTHSHSSSMLHLADAHKKAFPQAQERLEIAVPVTTLNEEFKDINLDRNVLLKIDVQGFEPQVLKGAVEILPKINYILLEVSFKPMYKGEIVFTEIIELLNTLGFKFIRPVDWLESPYTGEILQMDALFERS